MHCKWVLCDASLLISRCASQSLPEKEAVLRCPFLSHKGKLNNNIHTTCGQWGRPLGSDSKWLWSGTVRSSGHLSYGRPSRLESMERKHKQVLDGGQVRTTSMTRVCLPKKHEDKPGYILHKGDLGVSQTPLFLLTVTRISPITNAWLVLPTRQTLFNSLNSYGDLTRFLLIDKTFQGDSPAWHPGDRWCTARFEESRESGNPVTTGWVFSGLFPLKVHCFANECSVRPRFCHISPP